MSELCKSNLNEVNMLSTSVNIRVCTIPNLKQSAGKLKIQTFDKSSRTGKISKTHQVEFKENIETCS